MTSGDPIAIRRRVQALPDQSRRLLMVAAADPTGDPDLVWRAAGLLGIGAEAAAATEAGLVEFGAWVAFRHPLVRTAVYRSASPLQRQDVHRALAEVTAPRGRSRPPGLAPGASRGRARRGRRGGA